eukprot:TRINITY_DN36144_c0_g3_i1.p1 TRINITY_DN36144_c0_g3~~TRINITY_DN36144_c0_g3_i1.p1  ORF type:complete len:526 (-),score=76.81 TRINITY_DN36144_c0_g3_i1:168-1514(-)
MVPEKSALVVALQSFVCLGLIFMLWCFLGFTLVFGTPGISIAGWNFLGDARTYFALRGVQTYEPLERAGAVVVGEFPGMLFMLFQSMFAVLTPALMSGAFVDRMRVVPYMLFIGLWHFLVYCPIAYWNWGGGWMFQMGAWDFAGGMVVHEAAGFSALACLLVVGKRQRPPMPVHHSPHNIPLVIFGTALLWFGWFGFNAGSAMTIGGLATIAFVNTQIAPGVAMITWMCLDWFMPLKHNVKKPSALGICTGALVGLVVITPSAGFVQPTMAAAAGLIGTLVCWPVGYWVTYKSNLDDACFTVPIHGVGGLLGTLFVGLLSDPSDCLGKDAPAWCANPNTCTRSVKQFGIQLFVGLMAAIYCFSITWVLAKCCRCCGISHLISSQEDQKAFQDWEQLREVAYRRYEPQESKEEFMGPWLANVPYAYFPDAAPDTDEEESSLAEKSKSGF